MAIDVNAESFEEDGPARTILVGLGHSAVMGVAGAVIDAVKSGTVGHCFHSATSRLAKGN